MTRKLRGETAPEFFNESLSGVLRHHAGHVIILVIGVNLIARPAAAHAGTTHAGTPHWLFLLLVVAGGLIMGTVTLFARDSWTDRPRRTVTGFLLGLAVALLGTIAIIQIQIEPIGTTPTLHEWYPFLAGGVSLVVVTGSMVLGYWLWPARPEYSALGLALGTWIGYPALLPNGGYRHPLGYLLVGIVPLLVGIVLWRDVWPAVRAAAIDNLSRRTGTVVAGMFGVFFLFSAGLFTVNPEEGVNAPSEAFVTTARFANPLVVWPAVEFYLPSIPLAGAMSVGTAILIGLLAGLIGLNATLMTTLWRRSVDLSSSGGLLGGFATTGATACCCCGPAVYAVASVFLGVSASPLYWAFIDPASPLGALFFAAAVILLVWSAVGFAGTLGRGDACQRPPEAAQRTVGT